MRALKDRRRALAGLREYKRAAGCFGHLVSVHVARRPPRQAPLADWQDKRQLWQREAKRFAVRVGQLVHRMKHPGGSSNGVRWMPLARWVGWPSYTLSNLAYIIMRESSGRENARNPSGASGLLQLMPGWWTGQWGVPAGNPFDPEYNLRSGYLMWCKAGWQPWQL